MAHLIDDILAFSRLGRQQTKVQAIDMGDLFRSVADELLGFYEGPEVQIDIGPLPSTMGDRSMLSQLVTNLMSNALKYGAAADAPKVEVRARREGDQDIYSVRDYGVGFDEQYQNKLFGVFQRLHGENEFEGTGVGLAIAQRVVVHHQGKIWARSQLGQGACFYFSLPASS